jgi:mono/diheme cytochrome c family protein
MKKLIWIIPSLIVIIVIAFVLYVKFALPNVGPAPDINVEITPERLVRGEYLATTVMSCVDCHSHRDMTKFAGPVLEPHFIGGGDDFTEKYGAPGNFYAPNLTAFHLKDWSDGEIYRAIVDGVSKDGRALFPAMPYTAFRNASKEDIYSIIAFLRSLPSVENTVPEPEPKFPFSLIINFMPLKPNHQEIPNRKDTVSYGKYMTTVAGCVDCHTPMDNGQLIMDEAFTGNQEFILPNGIVRSANITPDTETGIGSWTKEAFLSRFKIYSDSAYVPQDVGNGFNTVMPWTLYSKMKTDDLKAIFTYLRTLQPVKKQVIKYSPNN